jgi:hypothetical protein
MFLDRRCSVNLECEKLGRDTDQWTVFMCVWAGRQTIPGIRESYEANLKAIELSSFTRGRRCCNA